MTGEERFRCEHVGVGFRLAWLEATTGIVCRKMKPRHASVQRTIFTQLQLICCALSPLYGSCALPNRNKPPKGRKIYQIWEVPRNGYTVRHRLSIAQISIFPLGLESSEHVRGDYGYFSACSVIHVRHVSRGVTLRAGFGRMFANIYHHG